MAEPNITELVTTTLTNQKKELVDNVADRIPLFWFLKRKKNMKLDGGSKIRESLIYATNGTVQYQGEYDTYDTTVQKEFDAAEFDWKIITGTVSLGGLTLAMNSGKEQIFNLLRSKIMNLKTSLANQLGSSVYSDGTTSNEIGGLQYLVADDPTTGTVGSINRATYSFWRNKIYDFSVESVTASSSTMVGSMDTAFRRTLVQGNEMPDLFLADNTYYGYYEQALQQYQRLNSPEVGQAGFKSLKYQGGDLLYDANCPSSHLYMLNTNHLFLKHLKADVFNVDSARSPYNQDTTVVPIKGYMNMTIDNSRVHCVMHA